MMIRTQQARRHTMRVGRRGGIALCAVACAALTSISLPAQAPTGGAGGAAAERFDVVSVKENRSSDPSRGVGFQPGGRFRARNMTIRGVIAAAYGAPQPIPLFRVIGGPNWIDNDRYDIEAMPSAEAAVNMTPPWPARGQVMLRALLADRFKLIARQETRDLPAYDLIVDNKSRLLQNRQFRESTGNDCVDRSMPTAPGTVVDHCGGFRFTPPERLIARYVTMDEVARFLTLNITQRPVVNRTGLTSHFSFEIDYSPALTAPSAAAPGADAPGVSGISIFTALTEQLGLKLQATTAPLDVVVIAAIDRPTPN